MRQLTLLCGLLCLLLWPGAALADGILIPHLPNRPIAPIREIPNFSVKYHRVNVDIQNQVAQTRVEQVFENHYSRDLEGTYLFPIPEGASLSQFQMDVDGRMTPAELLQANQARKIYEDIVRQRIDPGLLEYAGHNLYRARIFPIPARGEKKVALRYDQMLKPSSNLHHYRYVLSTEKFSQKPLNDVLVQVNISSKTPIKNIYSPSHTVNIRRINDYKATVSYESKLVKPDTDFELYYTTSEDPIGLSLMTFKEGTSDGYFMLMASPKVNWEHQRALPKQMTFILDTSGSMSGQKIKQAKAALEFNLNQLQPQDRFQLIAFSDTVEPFSREPLSATASNIQRAIQYINNLHATGGTDINAALLDALKRISSSQDLNMILFLTDGDPTVGETDFNKILANLDRANRNAARLFVFGVGFDVNIPFLDKMSLKHKGSSEYVRPEENIEVKVSNLFNRISHPILSDLKLDLGHIQTYDVLPRQLPDFFKGSQLVLTGRYRNAGNSNIRLSGQVQGEGRSYSWTQNFPNRNTDFDFIPRIWAAGKIGYLLDQIRLQGKNQELVDEIIRLSREYGIVTEYTSFLVRDDVDLRTANPAPALREEAESNIGNLMDADKGGSAISQSRNLKKLQQNAPAAGINRYYDAEGKETTVNKVRYVGQRAFFLKNQVWQDVNGVENLPKVKVKRFGAVYFALAQNKALRDILALGEQVEFVHNGHLVIVGDGGADALSPELQRQLKL